MAISNLIIPPDIDNTVFKKSFESSAAPPALYAPSTVRRYAELFVGSMGNAQRDRFRQMLQAGIDCGQSIAEAYNVPLDAFIDEVKKII